MSAIVQVPIAAGRFSFRDPAARGESARPALLDYCGTMELMSNNQFPKLRNLDLRPFSQDGRSGILLRDPLQLSDKMLMIPEGLLPVLSLCDGTRENASAVSASLAVRYGMNIPADTVEELLDMLDQGILLDNDTFREAEQRKLDEYRRSPYRLPVHAGQSYPADPEELRRLLDDYIEAANGPAELAQPPLTITERSGIISPHIDYERGGLIYAGVWNRAAKFVRAADLVVILGTDHYEGEGALTLTRQNYATPFGVLPTARDLVDELAKAMGEERAFAQELHHRTEHSIELAAVWLHHILGDRLCQIVPVLCGSFGRFMNDGLDPNADPTIGAFLSTLERVTQGRRVVFVAAGDLSHVGPAFGGDPLDLAGRARLRAADDEIIKRSCDGDAKGFLEAIRRVHDRNNVCGLSPIYLTLHLLGSAQGQRVAYDLCPADDQGTSVVSVCGVVLSDRLAQA